MRLGIILKAFVPAVVLLGGCAVITVDVDVYKGPLANHHDVQLQQAAVMAAGAKPLLVRLRDSLEAESQTQHDLAKLRHDSTNFYRARFIPDGHLYLQSDQALRVNDILALYEPEPTQIEQWLKSLARELGSAGTNYQVFQISLKDTNLWTAAEIQLRPNASDDWKRIFKELTLGKPGSVTNNEPVNSSPNVASVSGSNGTYRSTLEGQGATNIETFLIPFEGDDKKTFGITLTNLIKDLPTNYSVNHTFIWLADPRLAEAYEKSLFKTNAETADLRNRWVEVAEAFLKGRANLRSATEYTLMSISALANAQSVGPTPPERYIAELAELLGVLVYPDRLFETAMDRREFKDSALRKYLHDLSVESNGTGRNRVWLQSGGQIFHRDQANIVKRFVLRNPAVASRELLRAHYLQIKNGYPFGIGNTLNDEKNNSYVALFMAEVNRFASEVEGWTKILSGSGLEGGRLSEGLEQLTRAFLTAEENSPEKEKARKRLLDELIRFSEKTLFLANNDILMRPAYWRGLVKFVSQSAEGAFHGFSKIKDPPNPETYSSVLQVIANSILVEVDEIYQRDSHDTNAVKLFPQAREAMTRAYGTTPQQQMSYWKKQIEGDAFNEVSYSKNTNNLEAAKTTATQAVEKLQTAEDAYQSKSNAVVKATLIQKTFIALTNDPALDPIFKKVNVQKKDERDGIVRILETLALDASGAERTKRIDLTDAIKALQLTDADKQMGGDMVIKGFIRDLGDAILSAERAVVEPKKERDRAEELLLKAQAEKDQAEKAVQKDELSRRNLNVKKCFESFASDEVQGQCVDGRQLFEKFLALGGEKVQEISKKLAALKDPEGTDKKEKAEKEKEKQMCQDFLKFLKASPPRASDLASAPNDGTEPKHVLDQLIASLRYEYTHSILEYGKNSEMTARIAEALDAALDQRSGMIHIRPASSYLRTSFPSSALQQGTKVGWQNMLAEHGRRQMPFAGLLVNSRKMRTIQELDQQFWQNVNQVRVAGSGSANHVIAKDDLGNWYVKNYSADPSKMIKSAQNLAMFGLRPRLGALPIQSGSTGAILAGATNGFSQAQGPVGSQLNRTVTAYNEETANAYKTFAKNAKPATLGPKVVDAIKGAALPTESQTALLNVEEKARPGLLDLPENPADKKIPQDEIVAGLRGIDRYRTQLLLAAGRISDEADRSKAVKAIDGALKPVFSETLDSRIATVTTFKERVGVLSDLSAK